MNRHAMLVGILGLLMLMASACGGGGASSPVVPSQPDQVRTVSSLPDEYCGEPTEECLTIGQFNNEDGWIRITNNNDYIYVEVFVDDPWEITDTHVAVGDSLDDIPQTKNGNPQPGQFPYTAFMEIPVGDWECGTDLIVAVHAVVQEPDGYGGWQSQTAWGCGNPFPGKTWATYSMHTLQCCKELPALPEETVCAKAVKYPGDYSYFNTKIYNVPSGFEWLEDGWDGSSGYWLGWCADLNNYIYPGTEYCGTTLLSSYAPETWPEDARFDIDWPRINYVLNHKQGTPGDV
jgi:hypothetical protein